MRTGKILKLLKGDSPLLVLERLRFMRDTLHAACDRALPQKGVWMFYTAPCRRLVQAVETLQAILGEAIDEGRVLAGVDEGEPENRWDGWSPYRQSRR